MLMVVVLVFLMFLCYNSQTMEYSSTPDQFSFESEPSTIEKSHEILLDQLCEQLYPTTGFELTLEGIHPNTLTRKELEAFFKVELSEKHGATIILAYDIVTDSLELESFSYPLKQKPEDSFVIKRSKQEIDGLRYIPYKELSGESREYDKEHHHAPLIQDRITAVLAGCGIIDIPHPDHDSYRLWRASFLDKCRDGWKATEKVRLITGFIDDIEHNTAVEHSTTIMREITCQSNGQIREMSLLQRGSIYSSPHSDIVQETRQILAQDRDVRSTVTYAIRDSTALERDPFVIGKSSVLKRTQQQTPLTPETLESFTAIHDEASELLAYRTTHL